MATSDVLRSLSLQIDAGLDLLDSDLDLIEDISDSLESGVVDRSNYRRIHGTARLRIGRSLNWHSQRLRPKVTLTDTRTGESASWNLGVFLPETPARVAGETPQTFDVECYDLLTVLDDPVGETYRVASGAAYLSTVETIISDLGLTAVLDQTAASKTLPSARVWEIDGRNTWLRVVNDLLAAVGYRGVWADREGQIRSRPYVAPRNRASIWTYDTGDDETTVESISWETDLWQVPNKWVFIRDDPEQDLPASGDGIYTVTNQSDGAASIDQRGRTVTRIVRLDAADQTSLETQGDQLVDRDKQPLEHVDLTSSPNPKHWHADVVDVTAAEVGLTAAKFAEVSWSLPLDGSAMTHRLRRAS